MARPARQPAPSDTIKGELLEFTVRGADHWGTGVVRTGHDGGNVKIAGKVLGAKVGDTVELTGIFEQSKWGRQFKVRECNVTIPTDASGVVGWLASNLPQISRRRAEAMIELWGVEGTWQVLDQADTSRLQMIEGITEPRAVEIILAYRANKDNRDRIVRFKSWGLTDSQIARVLTTWGDDAEEKLKENPYLLIKHVDGFGWERSDAVAKRMGVRLDSPARLAAGLLDAMADATMHGHCFVPFGALVRVTAQKKCEVPEQPVEEALRGLLQREELCCRGTKVYLPRLAQAEYTVAKVFATRARLARMGAAS